MNFSSFFTCDSYSVFYRETNNEQPIYANSSSLQKFAHIKNPPFHWMADPFPFEINGETYIFAEKASYLTGKGSICYICLSDKKPHWRKAFKPKFHVSFPNIFIQDKKIFMIPESSHDHGVFLYEAEGFPSRWSKVKTLLLNDEYSHFVDTAFVSGSSPLSTFFSYGQKGGDHFLLRVSSNDKTGFTPLSSLKDTSSSLRPAGNIQQFGQQLIFPTQDCSNRYGGAIIFSLLSIDSSSFSLTEFSRIQPQDISRNLKIKRCVGIHTYNSSLHIETIDVIQKRFSFLGFFKKINEALFRR